MDWTASQHKALILKQLNKQACCSRALPLFFSFSFSFSFFSLLLFFGLGVGEKASFALHIKMLSIKLESQEPIHLLMKSKPLSVKLFQVTSIYTYMSPIQHNFPTIYYRSFSFIFFSSHHLKEVTKR